MEKTFLSQVGHLLRYYWRTEKHLYLRLYLGLAAFFLLKSLLLWFFGRLFSIEQLRSIFFVFNDEWVFWGFILICAAHMFSSLETKQRATTFLALPADNLAKFLSRVVYATLGIWLLAFAARVSANFIACLPALFDTLFMNGKLTLSQIVFGLILPGSWVYHPVFPDFLGFLLYISMATLMALWPWSLFTLCGVLFRRHGWLWAIPALFVGGFVAYTIFEVAIDRTWSAHHRTLALLLFSLFVLLPSAFNYWLCYRCFCRAQVVTDNPTRL